MWIIFGFCFFHGMQNFSCKFSRLCFHCYHELGLGQLEKRLGWIMSFDLFWFFHQFFFNFLMRKSITLFSSLSSLCVPRKLPFAICLFCVMKMFCHVFVITQISRECWLFYVTLSLFHLLCPGNADCFMSFFFLLSHHVSREYVDCICYLSL